VVSLDSILEKQDMQGHVSLVNDVPNDRIAFGVFRPKHHDLFISSNLGSSFPKNQSIGSCLQESAYQILKHEIGYLKITLPNSPQEIRVSEDKSARVGITISKAEQFYLGDNLFLIGDAAGNGHPWVALE
jgi:hypothetical protein